MRWAWWLRGVPGHQPFPLNLFALHQTRRRLAEGTELGDKKMILEALAKADELRKEWGPIDIPEPMFAAAREMLDIIQKEEVILHDVSMAMSVGKISGKPGSVDSSKIDVSRLDGVIERAKTAVVRTRLGLCLLSFAKVIRDLRLSVRAGDYDAVERAVAAGKDLCKGIQGSRGDQGNSGLPPECAAEFQLIVNELDDRAVIK